MAKNGKTKGSDDISSLPAVPLPITQKELESAGQQRLRLLPYSEEEGRRGIDWWTMRLLHAEAAAGNPEASAKPGKWVEQYKARLTGDEKSQVVAKIVDEWKEARATGTLDEPIWSEKVVRSHALSRGAPA